MLMNKMYCGYKLNLNFILLKTLTKTSGVAISIAGSVRTVANYLEIPLSSEH